MPTHITTNTHPAAASLLNQLQRQGLSPLAAAVLVLKPAAQPVLSPAGGPGADHRTRPLAPRHIAIAPGGHRLWAADRLMPEAAALIEGLDCLMETVAFCSGRQVEQLTFLSMPSDHALGIYEWGAGGYWRPTLMRAVWAALNKLPNLRVRLRLEGDWPELDDPLMVALLEAQARTRSNTGMRLNLRQAQPLSFWDTEKARESEGQTPVAQENWAKEGFVAGAGTAGPEPDLVIRTGGSSGTNDGMVWDTTHSAQYFTNRAWPSFTELDLRRALHWYSLDDRPPGLQVGLPAREHEGLATSRGIS
jgi:undecaprenyl diphosphate synthase